METTEPCNICGSTETNLVDGFYYCVECGTQDTNVRETLVDYTVLGDGTFALAGSRKRITQIPKAKEAQMTDDWYNWHSLNFLLKGLADELIELGAAPSFKTKLLWLWTRYMKKYQNKADFGLATNEESGDSEEDEEKPTVDANVNSSDEEEFTKPKSKYDAKNIEKVSSTLIISFLYVALNLDKSRIQLTHLLRFVREGRLSIMHWQKLVPAEMKPRTFCRLFKENMVVWFSTKNIRICGLELFRKLDLGNPVVPDLRPLVEEYLQELCLPNDLKPLVFSLLHYRSFDYLDINVKVKQYCFMPSYELHVMCHILLAVKICFGLDCEYEVKLSDAVDKINELEDNPKSYYSQTTERLFNFRDWCSYIQFRKALLRTHTLHLGAPNSFDMNDYVAFEHHREMPDFKINFKDEIAFDIINKIPSGELNVIPEREFVPTMTPHTTYTRVILDHQQDHIVKQLLSEDFTQYSLKYIIKDMFLVDPDSTNPTNIITGVSESNMQQSNTCFGLVDPTIVFPRGMVYVKDCENHNWMVTQRPKLEHVTTAGKISDSDEKENDHGYVSNTETLQNVMKVNNINLDDTQTSMEIRENSVVAIDNNNLSSIKFEKETEKEERNDDAMIVDNTTTNIDSDSKCLDIDEDKNEQQQLKIREEDASLNIFDDDFVDLETKKEKQKNPEEMELQENYLEYNDNDVPCEINRGIYIPPNKISIRYNRSTQDYGTSEKESDASSIDSIRLNPESLVRDEAIKELIIHACNKYKVSIPGTYLHIKRQKFTGKVRKKYVRNVKPKFQGETTLKINGLISDYLSHLQEDILHQMSNMVQGAISDFNNTNESEMPVESEDLPHSGDGIDAANDQTIENEPSDTNQEQNPSQNETVASVVEDNQYNLFGDSSDGETHAEDLLPKKKPEFDEETHDITQLYIKLDENPSVPEMRLNPNLIKIVNRKFEADENVRDPQQKQDKPEDTDSEEDISISVLQDLKRIREQLTEQQNRTKGNRLRPLIRSDIPPYNIWVRHYETEVTGKSNCVLFKHELDEKLPKSFVFVLKECADVVGYSIFEIYKYLQRVEECIKDKYVSRKRCVKKKKGMYFVKQKRSKKNRET